MSTKIEWTDRTWNPVTGCDAVSPGCDNCYAEGIAHRFAGTPQFPNGFRITLRPERLEQPLKWRKPSMVFVNSMSDLFHKDIPDEYIARVFAVMARAPRHTFQVLTKRHGRMRSLLNSEWFLDQVGALAESLPGWPLPNVWMGVSAENQKWADMRIPALLDTPAAVRFISAEPLLGPIDLASKGHLARDEFERGLDWAIVGGESGPKARPMHPDWVRTLRDQCTSAGVAFLFKQWGTWAPNGFWRVDTGRPPENPHEHLFTEGGRNGFLPSMARVGKKAAGRELDGRTWDEFPEASA